MKEYFRTEEIDYCTTDNKHHLSQKNQPNKTNILAFNTYINNTLCQKRKY